MDAQIPPRSLGPQAKPRWRSPGLQTSSRRLIPHRRCPANRAKLGMVLGCSELCVSFCIYLLGLNFTHWPDLFDSTYQMLVLNPSKRWEKPMLARWTELNSFLKHTVETARGTRNAMELPRLLHEELRAPRSEWQRWCSSALLSFACPCDELLQQLQQRRRVNNSFGEEVTAMSDSAPCRKSPRVLWSSKFWEIKGYFICDLHPASLLSPVFFLLLPHLHSINQALSDSIFFTATVS